jgi:hypothetical protein
MLIIIIMVAYDAIIIWQKLHATHLTKQIIYFFTGTIGSGKTFLATTMLKFCYRMALIIYKIKGKKKGSKPIIYSNIPLYINKKTDVHVLKREHLLLQETFEKGCTPFVLLDELSMIATCYNWDDPNIVSKNLNDNMKTLETFIRFYRHFYGASNHDRLRMFITDQATGGVNIQMRRRIGYVNYLYNMRRFAFILPWAKINTKEMVIEEDTVNENDTETKEKDRNYFFVRMPYKWVNKLFRRKQTYDSHCYRKAMLEGKMVSKLDFEIWPKNDLTTNYCPDIRMSEKEKAQYKAKIKHLYHDEYLNELSKL